MRKIEQLYQLGKTVYTIHELRMIWQESNANALKTSVKYFVDTGRFLRLRKGIYALSADYNTFELAQKLMTPSYISFDTALQFHGIIFQLKQTITSAATHSKHFAIEGKDYSYFKLQDSILFHPMGILKKDNYSIAGPERAVADTLYLCGETYFDSLLQIDKEKLRKIGSIYQQKSTQNLIEKLIKNL